MQRTASKSVNDCVTKLVEASRLRDLHSLYRSPFAVQSYYLHENENYAKKFLVGGADCKSAEDCGWYCLRFKLDTECLLNARHQARSKGAGCQSLIGNSMNPLGGKGMKKVVLAMSGGVDSSVAAWLLLEQGYDVVGVTMQLWQAENPHDVASHGGCCGITAIEDARGVCNKLGIDHYVLNFRDAFKKAVIEPFVAAYMAGRTPNPCIACNRYVKWQYLYEKAKLLDADFIATGHYAHIAEHGATGRLTIRRSASPKDQSYALYNLSQQALAQTLFPLKDMVKDDVRRIAHEKIGLHMGQKPDSQEICFVPDKNHSKFLQEYLGKPLTPGNFVDTQGRALGAHGGLGRYTIGQRKGLGAFGAPMFVKAVDAKTAAVTLTPDEEELFEARMSVHDLNFMSHAGIEGQMPALGKIRYAHKPAPCIISQQGDKIICAFQDPQRAITPGQSAVFYDEDGGIICGGIII